jgi:hypothetical protein
MIAQTKFPTLNIDPISVDRLTSYIEQALLQTPELRQVWVCGEVSSATHHPSGIYFNLKDKVGRASLPAVIWKSQIPELATKLQIGIEVLAFGKIAIYAPHGKYQFQVQQVLPLGEVCKPSNSRSSDKGYPQKVYSTRNANNPYPPNHKPSPSSPHQQPPPGVIFAVLSYLATLAY